MSGASSRYILHKWQLVCVHLDRSFVNVTETLSLHSHRANWCQRLPGLLPNSPNMHFGLTRSMFRRIASDSRSLIDVQTPTSSSSILPRIQNRRIPLSFSTLWMNVSEGMSENVELILRSINRILLDFCGMWGLPSSNKTRAADFPIIANTGKSVAPDCNIIPSNVKTMVSS